MPEFAPRTCEVKIDGAWATVPLAEAHAHHGSAPKRCPACHGRVTIAGNYTARASLKMAHRKAHDGCPVMSERYTGTPSPHPDALV